MRFKGDASIRMFIGSLVLLSPAAATAATDEDRQLVENILTRLIAVAERVEDYEWPPTWEISDDSSPGAHAVLLYPAGTDKKVPHIVVYQGLLDQVAQGNEKNIVWVLGHELAHIVLRHVEQAQPGTPLVALALNREDETAADITGVQMALSAGYSHADILQGMKRTREVWGPEPTFEGLDSTHPTVTDRLATIDAARAQLWPAMSAFENGCFFLACEQYDLAELCFRQVTKEFPDCYEAWANRGYAWLMMYCDLLETDDLREFDIGHLVVGGFYRRPVSIEARGVDPDMWFEAVGSLREALRLKPDLVLAKANLAVAYLVHPEGKDVGRATQLFEEVSKSLLQDGATSEEIDPMTRAALLVNAGVSELAGGSPKACAELFALAEQELRQLERTNSAVGGSNAVERALRYNRALLLADPRQSSEGQPAVEQLESYLASTSSAVAWWPLAYERYTALCNQLQRQPKPAEELQRRVKTPFRLVTGIKLADDTSINLMDKLRGVEDQLGEGVHLPVMDRKSLQRVRYEDLGLDLLGTDLIIALRLFGPEAPPVTAQVSGLSGASREIRVGMSQQELRDVLGSEFEDCDRRRFTAANVWYRYYRSLGIGILLKKGTVEEIVIAQLPEEPRPR